MTKFLVPLVIILGILLALRLGGVFEQPEPAPPPAAPQAPTSAPAEEDTAPTIVPSNYWDSYVGSWSGTGKAGNGSTATFVLTVHSDGRITDRGDTSDGGWTSWDASVGWTSNSFSVSYIGSTSGTSYKQTCIFYSTSKAYIKIESEWTWNPMEGYIYKD